MQADEYCIFFVFDLFMRLTCVFVKTVCVCIHSISRDTDVFVLLLLSAQLGYLFPFVEQRVAEVQLELLEIGGRTCRESAVFCLFFLLLSFFMLV